MNPEVKEPVAEQPKIETNMQQQKPDPNVTQEQPKVEQETEKDINWKKFKEARQKEREHAEAMAKKAADKEAEAAALKAAMEAMLNKPSPQQSQEQYNQNEESEDERIEKKVQAAISKREAEYLKQRQEKEKQDLPNILVQHMPDFNQVCSTENLDYLDYHYPEVAKAFNYMPDNIEKWSAVYKSVKRFVPNTDTRKDVAKMNQNMNKPQSLSAPGTTQPGIQKPIYLDEERRAANYARMQKVIKGLS
jgi:hypothetical protein